ncbi:MAG: hypothetical protein KGN84_01635 [Acidobacteriota bacterium]|nr:hypothetical protein [Acidobacteriota bacterium]
MRYTLLSLIGLSGLLANAALAQQAKPNFSGTWKLDSGKSQVHSGKPAVVSLAIEQKDSSIHVTRKMKAADGTETTVEFTCTTDGQDCDGKSAGKVSFFFDGPALIEMDVSDDQISRTIMTLDDKQTVCASVSYIFPKAESDALVFDKQ